ncbi:hypothetical protein EON79_01855 [bacterium]|nr:MAG: hypothetical protein EON79_01855 [bacterium]
MADERDIRAMKVARAEFTKHGFDTARADLHVTRGVLHIGGIIQIPGRSDRAEVTHDIDTIARVLKTRPEFRDVVIDAIYTS